MVMDPWDVSLGPRLLNDPKYQDLWVENPHRDSRLYLVLVLIPEKYKVHTHYVTDLLCLLLPYTTS